jgi:hypothetical protein
MDHTSSPKSQGVASALLLDQDLKHLERVLGRSLAGDLGGPVLPPAYWRQRLGSIVRAAHLSPTQLQTVHRLYMRIDGFEAAQAKPADSAPEQASSIQTPQRTA